MKKTAVSFFLICTLICVSGKSQTIYSHTLIDINGDTIDNISDSLKTIYIVVPFHSSDSLYQKISNFKADLIDSVTKVIGIVSIEDGYSVENKLAIKQLYDSLHITLTEPMYTRKTSSQQSDLMKWLTHKNLNNYYDEDVKGIGHKFFINRQGNVYAVLPPEVPLDAPIVNMMINP
jgi:hypothetical protein